MMMDKKKRKLKAGEELPQEGVRTKKDVFYLNDFYDLLFEKEDEEIQIGENKPTYSYKEKYYTMGPGIDFPMVMNYKDTEMPVAQAYFYFLNGHNDVVYFSNSTFNDFETYEYFPWRVLMTSSNKNNLLYIAREFDFDTGLQFNRARYYNPEISRFTSKEPLFFEKNKFFILCNNPVSFRDPDGLLPPWWPIVIVIGMISCAGGVEDELAAGGEECVYKSVSVNECTTNRICITNYTCKPSGQIIDSLGKELCVCKIK